MTSLNLYQIKQYFRFRKLSKNQYGIHSPFVFNLVREVLHKGKNYYSFNEIESLRKALKKNKNTLKVTDLGAGSKVLKKKDRKISDIVSLSSSPPKFAQIIFRLANKFQPDSILELGTSLGILTSYLGKACPKASIIGFEGCSNIRAYAMQNMEKLHISNIEIIEGNMDQTLQKILESLPKVDFAVVDGNHTEEATLNYGRQLIEKCHEDSILVFDDIYWSEGMTNAWEALKKEEMVTLSIDLFKIGILFFRTGMETQHFKIRV